MPFPPAMGTLGAALKTGLFFLGKHLFAVIVGAAVVNNATDNKLATGILATGDAVLGADNMKRVGRAIEGSTRYVGEGIVGAAKTIENRYGTNIESLPVSPATAKIGFLTGSATLSIEASLRDKGISYATLPVQTKFAQAVYPVSASTPTPEPSKAENPVAHVTPSGRETPGL